MCLGLNNVKEGPQKEKKKKEKNQQKQKENPFLSSKADQISHSLKKKKNVGGGFNSLFTPFTPVKGPWEKTVVERSGGGKERNCFLKTPHLPIGSWEREDRETALASPLNPNPQRQCGHNAAGLLCLLADSLRTKKLI